MNRTKPDAPVKSAGIYFLFAAGAVSAAGNSITNLAVPWFVLETTNSPGQTGISGAFSLAAIALSAFFGGAIIDRLGYKFSSVISDVASGVCVILIPLLYATGWLAYWHLLILVFCGALLDTPGQAARAALLPDLAKRAAMPLERANSWQEIAVSGAMLGGSLVAGLLITMFGAVNALWFNAAGFAAATLLIVVGVPSGLSQRTEKRLDATAQKNEPEFSPPNAEKFKSDAANNQTSPQSKSNGYFADLKQGFRFVINNPLMRTLSVLGATLEFLLAPLAVVVLPVYAKTTGNDPLTLGLMETALLGGVIIGTLVYGSIGHRLPRRIIFLIGLTGIAAAIATLAFVPPLWVLLPVLLAAGVLAGPNEPLVAIVLQERTPPEMRGRVFGMMAGIELAATPFGVLLIGLLLESFDLRVVIILIAVCFGGFTVALFFNNALRSIEAKENTSN